MAEKMKGKRGQVAIWVILALALVVSMVVFFTIESGKPIISIGADKEFTPDSYIEKCVRNSVNEFVDAMILHGGFIDDKNVKMYGGINVSYLCLTNGYYEPCINQHPMLLNEMEEEIKINIEPDVEDCFSDLQLELEDKNWDVSIGQMEIDVSIVKKKIVLDVQRRVTISKDDTSQTFENFESEVSSPLYDLANTAIEISNEEAKYCYFEYLGYNMINSDIDIRKDSMSDSTKIYTLKDKKSGKEMNIAIRSCAIPPGI